MAIYQGSTLVRRIWTGRALAAGTYGWTWNGRTAAGAFVKPGSYRVVVDATSSDRAVADRPQRHRPGAVARPLDWHLHDRALATATASPPSPATPEAPRPGRRGSSCRPTTRPRTSARSRPPILAALPDATLLVVDDGSPDGTGRAGRRPGRRRPARPGPPPGAKQGLGARLPRWLRRRARRRRRRSSSRWTPTSATTRRPCPALVGADRRRRGRPRHRLALHGRRRRRRLGHRPAARLARRQPLRPDRPAACGRNDLTGGFKAWRAATLAAVPFDGVHAGGYVFQIEMTFRASRAGARIREVPITFRDRRVGQIEDEPADRRRGAGRRRPAAGRGARARRARAGGRRGRERRRGARSPRSARPSGAAGRPRRPRRPAAPGPERAPLTAAYLDGPARRLRRRPARRRVVRVPARAPTSTIRPTDYEHLEVVGRRLLPPTRLLRSAAHDRRPVPAARRARSGPPGGPNAVGRPAPSTTPSVAARCRSPRACRSS